MIEVCYLNSAQDQTKLVILERREYFVVPMYVARLGRVVFVD